MNLSFKHEFSTEELEAGYELYLQNEVDDLEVHQGDIHAYVMDCKVNVYTQNGSILDMDCTCGESQNACQHEAAVLFEVTKQEMHHDHHQKQPQQSDKDILQGISKQQLNAFILEYMKENPSFRLQLQSYFNSFFPMNEMDYIKEWKHIRNEVDYRYITYDESASFERKTSQLLSKLEKGVEIHCYNVFHICSIIFDDVVTLLLEDDNEQFSNEFIPYKLKHLIQLCIGNSDANTKKRIQKWLLACQDKGIVYECGLDDVVESLYFSTLSLQEQINYQKEHMYHDTSVEELISLFHQSQMSQEAIDHEVFQYIELDAARDWIVQYLLKHHKIDQAIEILCEKANQKNSHTKQQFAIQLIHVYEQYHYMEAYHQRIREYFKEETQGILELFQEYKTHFSLVEWNDLKKELISLFSSMELRAEAYYQEDMKEELMLVIEQNPIAVQRLYVYETILKDAFSSRLLDLYEQKIQNLSHYADQMSYQQIDHILRHMLALSTGEKRVSEIVQHLLQTYKRRRSLVALLKKIPVC